jgi:ribonuclease Z
VIRVTFLGTSASRPTVGRNVSGLAVQREGDLMLFDCGEGTQRQMMRYGTGFAVGAIFVTHMHADHFLGITGLLRTLGLQGRVEPLELYGPSQSRAVLELMVHLGVERIPFPVSIRELAPGDAVRRDGYQVVAFQADHGMPAVGYALVEEDRLGRFDVERARALGVPDGPLFGRLHRGEAVDLDGRTIHAHEVVGPARPGRRVVYTGDTRPCSTTAEIARAADLLVHDSTFAEEEAERARETYHATAAGAARVARDARARRLLLTHVSSRYAENPRVLEEEAEAFFPGARVAQDGLVLEIPFADEGADIASGVRP